MKRKILKLLSISLICVSLMLISTPSEAQCPMCRMAAESNLKNGGTAGKGLNNGILYMLTAPYLLVGAIGYIWWRNRRREDELEEA